MIFSSDVKRDPRRNLSSYKRKPESIMKRVEAKREIKAEDFAA